MIGSSLPLCYPQIDTSNLLSSRAPYLVRPLTKHIRLGVGPAFFGSFLALAEPRFDGDSTVPPEAGNASR